MARDPSRVLLCSGFLAALFLLATAAPASAQLDFGAEQLLAAGGIDIDVPGYSVPSYVRWDGDGRRDLVVGEGAGGITARVRVYLNTGTRAVPQFGSFFYAQSMGSDLIETGSGCMGLFPRVVYWDGDGLKDLLMGLADGKVKIYLNIATDDAPAFDAGTYLQVGPAGSKVDINVAGRATPSCVDWDNDGRKDLIVGGYDGRIRIYLNQGTDTAPDFVSTLFVQDSGVDLVVPTYRASPVVADMNGDGKKDILAGNTAGQVLFYANTGTDSAPVFSGYTAVTSGGVPIDLAGTPRSRIFLGDWSGDGYRDLFVGAGDGLVRLYQAPAYIPSLSEWGLMLLMASVVAAGAAFLLRRA